MPQKPITIPNFRTEADEADWWDVHPEVATETMRRAVKSGKTKRKVPLKTAYFASVIRRRSPPRKTRSAQAQPKKLRPG